MQLLQNASGTGKRSNDARQDSFVPDFIPYACHYNPHTLLTKNGELLQTIKIVGFTAESVDSTGITLREAVRKAMLDNLPSDNYALWFHTIRRKKNLDPGGQFPAGFPSYLNRRWAERHQWDNKYINELYITIARDGQGVGISTPNEFMRALAPGQHRKYREKFLNDAYQELNTTVEAMLATLQLYGARRLGMVERKTRDTHGAFSEILEFLSKIVNLQQYPMPVPECDISDYLPARHIAFGYDAVEVKSEEGSYFGAILTIKEYKELSTRAIDAFLQIPQEFIICQCINFINAEKVKSSYAYQRYITDLSEDQELYRLSGLSNIFNSDRGSAIDYGEHQLSILLLNTSLPALEKDVAHACRSMEQLGIVVMREDVKIEDCFWSLLPGNFEFITRHQPINTARAAGFASLHNFPAGQAVGNLWGPAVTVFYTAAGTPYFFNFHTENRGHTAIIGPYGAGKTVMLNFLCSEARKFGGRLFFFDKDRGSQIFINALGGRYHFMKLDTQAKKLQLNPLLLPPSDTTLAFLTEWVWSLMTAQGAIVPDTDIAAIEQAVQHTMQGEKANKRIKTVASHLSAQNRADLVALLAPWHGQGEYAYLFDHEQDMLDLSAPIHGFEMGQVIEDNIHKPVLEYLLYRVSLMLGQRPTIIVLDEAWEMLDNDLFAPKIVPWLESLTAQNALAILATESVEQASQSSVNSDIMSQLSTEIYLPNSHAGPAYQDVFKLSEKEFSLLKRMHASRRHFLLKHAGEAVIAQLDLSGMEDLLCVLASSPERIALFEKVMAEHGHKPEDWLPTYQHLWTSHQSEQADTTKDAA